MRTLPLTTIILALIAITGGCSDRDPEYTVTCYHTLDGKKEVCEKTLIPRGDAAIRMKGSLE